MSSEDNKKEDVKVDTSYEEQIEAAYRHRQQEIEAANTAIYMMLWGTMQ